MVYGTDAMGSYLWFLENVFGWLGEMVRFSKRSF